MIAFPFCKINLGLSILSKRTDGFHSIETCFYPVPWTDILEIIPSDEFVFTTSGISIEGNLSTNLCVRAYALLQTEFNLPPVSIHLHKIIPMGAGLGGGSSDAAFTLLLLNQLFELKLSIEHLKRYASQLGSDCSFFLEKKPQMGESKGEELSHAAVDLENKFLVIVKPDIHVSTQEAYAGVNTKSQKITVKELVENQLLPEWKDHLINDFEESVFKKFPVISEIKKSLYAKGATYASMSGSGSSVFGIFEKSLDLKSSFSGCTYWSGLL
jgi:4-diphosphocytidyl-2-C-methyl-D-erythritol kinase